MKHEPPACPGVPAEGPALGTGDAPSDQHLLQRFLSTREAEAFALIVRRHGRVVLGLCRRILRHDHDAEDAFQATFLILARGARELRRQDALASWLCGVAARVALRLKSQRSRRLAHEQPAGGLEAAGGADPAAAAARGDDAAALAEELGRLPEKYRAPLVLCELEGETTERAAVRLRCPASTLKSRLARARDLLRDRLRRRGVVAGVALTALLAAVPPGLHAAAAVLAAADPSPRVAELARRRGGLRPWVWLPWAAALALVGVVSWPWRAPPPPSAVREAVAPPAAKAGPTLIVANQRCETVSLIDITAGRIRAALAADPCPHEVALSPGGATAAVSSYGLPFGKGPGDSVRLFDAVTGRLRATVRLGRHALPHGLHWLDERRLLCTSEATRTLVEIDAGRGAVARTLDAGPDGPHWLAVAADGGRAYTTGPQSNRISVFDLRRWAKVGEVELAHAAGAVALSPDGRRLYVVSPAGRAVHAVDTSRLVVVQTAPTGAAPSRVAVSPDGGTVVVTEPEGGALTVYEAGSMRPLRRVDFGRLKGPGAVAFSPDGRLAYCTVRLSHAVAVVDPHGGKVVARLPAGLCPDGIVFAPGAKD